MEITSETTHGTAVCRVTGKIDALTGPDLDAAVGSAIDAGSPRIILDLREVTYVSSAGLRAILTAAKQAAAAQGGLAVFGLQSAVREAFEISGFQKIILIAPDESQARSRLGA